MTMESVRVPAGTEEETIAFIRQAVLDRGGDPDTLHLISIGDATETPAQPLTYSVEFNYDFSK